LAKAEKYGLEVILIAVLIFGSVTFVIGRLINRSKAN